MNIQNIFPKAVLAAIDIAVDNISRLPQELWDDATAVLVGKLKKKAETANQLDGSKFLADVQEHIEEEQYNQIYVVVKRRTTHAVHG